MICFTMCSSIHYMMVWFVAVRGPSEQLMQNQMIKRGNRHSCPFCNQCFSCPANLCVHIRYRHLDSKPFKCSFCEYGWVEASFSSHWVTVSLTLIQEAFGSNLSWNTSFSVCLFHGFPRPSRQMLGWYLKLGHYNFLANHFQLSLYYLTAHSLRYIQHY
jgi:hypothetical protein